MPIDEIATYRPGEWLAAVTPRGAALLAPETGDELVQRVWRALSEGDGLGAVLGALVGAFGTSLASLPPFAVVTTDEATGEVQVVARGALRATVTDAAGAVEDVSGLGVSTWREMVVANATELVVTAFGEGGCLLPIRDGVVRAGMLRWSRMAPASTVREHVAGEPQPQQEPAAEPEASPSPEPEPQQEPASEPEPAAEPEPEPVVETGAGPSSVSGATGETTLVPVVESTITGLDPEPAPEPVGDDTTGYDFLLFGETRISSVEDAAVRTAPGMIEGIPRSPSPTPAALGDHDGETISSELLAAIQAERAQGDADPGGAVAASGGLRAMPFIPAAPVLVVSTGERLTLDRTAVVGRRPRALRATGLVPHLVTVPSPRQDVSRSHVELRVEGDDIVAVDLDTTNGTKLLRVGSDPVRLTPGEATLLVQGDRLDLGDGILLDFEGLA